MLNTKPNWQKTFLDNGSNKGCGDLSSMIEVVGRIIENEVAESKLDIAGKIHNLVMMCADLEKDFIKNGMLSEADKYRLCKIVLSTFARSILPQMIINRKE